MLALVKQLTQSTLNLHINDLEDLRETLKQEINKLTPDLISSVTGWQFILEAVSVGNI